MNPVSFAKSKAISAFILAALTIIAPQWTLSILGASLDETGAMVARLYGLLALLGGLTFIRIERADQLTPWDCAVNILCDLSAAVVLVIAVQMSAVNWLAYLLAAGYVSNAFGFFNWRRHLLAQPSAAVSSGS